MVKALLPAILLISVSAFGFENPSPSLTPGMVDKRAALVDICQPGYAKRARKVSIETKKRVFQRYEVNYVPKNYEVDHLIPLSLGGSNDIRNLWPEPILEARKKDVVERYLHRLVCDDETTLGKAQESIVKDWPTIYRSLKK